MIEKFGIIRSPMYRGANGVTVIILGNELGYLSSNPEQSGIFRGAVAHAMDKDIVVAEFEILSRYYVQFWTNTLGKGMNSLFISS